MKAIVCERFGGPDTLVMQEIADPQPGPGEVVVDVHAAGVNFPDTLIIQGKYQIQPPLPFTPGGEAAGVICAVGKGISAQRIGERVVAISTHGAFAQKMIAPGNALIPVPDALPSTTAAGFAIAYGTSFYALKQRANLQPGETLLVLGAAGGVGLAAVQLGKQMGAVVIAAASNEEKLDTACAAGATQRINYTTENLKQRVKELTDGKGADVVYDPVGGELAQQAFRATAWNGRYLVIGFASGTIPDIALNLPLVKGSSIVGVFWGAWALREPAQSGANFAQLLSMVADGRLTPLVSGVYPMDKYADALDCLLQRHAKGKVILQISPSEH